ncbi:hypothetical protein PVK06_027055 [Gossypium arboreum]|uniref:Uncharacterized protein n=1 Tax=Gossypium arboreum TaxID=29729 RepID=A0ABR0NZA6_GOSAR|nr:hypothetical protein PVK06_027055 [Gossypium arboreum]
MLRLPSQRRNYSYCGADPLDARCLDSMELLLGTPPSFRFVPPGVRFALAEQSFDIKIRMKYLLAPNL